MGHAKREWEGRFAKVIREGVGGGIYAVSERIPLYLHQTRVFHQVFMLFCCIAIAVSEDDEEANYRAGAVE